MEQIIVTRRNGTTYPLAVKKEATAITQAQQSWGVLGDDLVQISIESPFPQQHEIGDWISVFGRIYTLNQLPRVRKSGVHKYAYDLTFEGVQYDLLRAFYDVTIETTGNTLQDVQGDALTGNLKRFATVLIANANRVFPDKWKLGTCPDTASDKTLTFGDGDNCLAVYQNLCKTFDVEANISVRDDVRTIDFVKRVGTTHPFVFEFGKGKGLYALDRQNVDSSNIVTRLKVFGSADNITNKYRANRLCLPGKSKAQSFIEEATAIQKYGIHEARKVFEDIKPTFNGRVSELVAGSVLKFKDASMFDLNALEADGRTTKYLVAGVSAKIHFNTGNLAGYEFDIHKYDHATRTFTLKKLTDDRGAVFPSATSVAFQFSVGDEYKILDVTLPEQYQTDAERRLQEQGNEYYRQNSQPKVKYGLSVSKEYLMKLFADGTTSLFTPGDYINIKDESIGVDKAVRIQSLQRSLFDVYNYTLTIADVAESNITTRVISELLEIDKITTLHQLKDPTRAKANWRSSREVLDMVFDPEGDYYTDKIKPNSIDTLALSVGAKSMQFALQNVVFDANYQGQKNVVKVSAGTLTHYTIEDNPRTWIVAPAVVSLDEENTPYYILARCSKSGESATIVFSKSPIRVEQEAGMYHFWIGVVNSVDETLQARSIALSYGFSTINGRFIKTGRIESADGNTYFDLDAGEIRGNILFKGGKTLDNVVDTAIRTLSIGGRNLIKNSNKNQERKRGYLMVQEHDLTEDWKAGETYTISVCCGIERDKGVLLYIWGGSYQLAEVTNRTNSEDKDGLKWGVYTATFTISESTINSISDWHKKTYEIFQNGGEGDFILKWIKLEKGNKATDYTEAPEDTAEAIKKVETDSTAKANQALNDAKTFAREEDDKREKALRAEIMQDYLRQVIKDGSTLIKGGLLATNVIALKSTNGKKISSYIDGNQANNIAFATGVTDAFTTDEKRAVEITHDGNARFGQMHLNGHDGVLSFAPIGSAESYLNIGGVARPLEILLGGALALDSLGGNAKFEFKIRGDVNQDNDHHESKVIIDRLSVQKDGTTIKFFGDYSLDVSQDLVDYDSPELMHSVLVATDFVKRDAAVGSLEVKIIKIGERGEEERAQMLYMQTRAVDGSIHNEKYSSILTLEQGEYKVIANFDHYGSMLGESRTIANVNIQTELTKKSTEVYIGKDSMYAVFGRENFLHVSEQGTTIKGKTDMPGVLAAGIARTTGTVQNAYGAKVNSLGYDSAHCERQSDNSYKVYHSIGHSNYSVQVTVFGDSRDAGCVMDIQDYYFTCCFYNPVDTYKEQHNFTYLCIGPNPK
ncbi:MAG: phage tail protein [Porphyromonas sp.]|nr:phage tail protein [Porphyromonas sp.]